MSKPEMFPFSEEIWLQMQEFRQLLDGGADFKSPLMKKKSEALRWILDDPKYEWYCKQLSYETRNIKVSLEEEEFILKLRKERKETAMAKFDKNET